MQTELRLKQTSLKKISCKSVTSIRTSTNLLQRTGDFSLIMNRNTNDYHNIYFGAKAALYLAIDSMDLTVYAFMVTRALLKESKQKSLLPSL